MSLQLPHMEPLSFGIEEYLDPYPVASNRPVSAIISRPGASSSKTRPISLPVKPLNQTAASWMVNHSPRRQLEPSSFYHTKPEAFGSRARRASHSSQQVVDSHPPVPSEGPCLAQLPQSSLRRRAHIRRRSNPSSPTSGISVDHDTPSSSSSHNRPILHNIITDNDIGRLRRSTSRVNVTEVPASQNPHILPPLNGARSLTAQTALWEHPSRPPNVPGPRPARPREDSYEVQIISPVIDVDEDLPTPNFPTPPSPSRYNVDSPRAIAPVPRPRPPRAKIPVHRAPSRRTTSSSKPRPSRPGSVMTVWSQNSAPYSSIPTSPSPSPPTIARPSLFVTSPIAERVRRKSVAAGEVDWDKLDEIFQTFRIDEASNRDSSIRPVKMDSLDADEPTKAPRRTDTADVSRLLELRWKRSLAAGGGQGAVAA